MNHLTNEEKYNIIKTTCYDKFVGAYLDVGIHNFGLLHEIAKELGIRDTTGGNLHYITTRINQIMRDLIRDGYPIKEYKIKCCSWSSKETWHPIFVWEE